MTNDEAMAQLMRSPAILAHVEETKQALKRELERTRPLTMTVIYDGTEYELRVTHDQYRALSDLADQLETDAFRRRRYMHDKDVLTIIQEITGKELE